MVCVLLITANYKVSGIWKTTKPYAKIGGAWQVPKSAWKKIGSSWKSWFLQSGVIDSGYKEYDNHKGFGINYILNVIKKQTDGKFVVGGTFTSVNGLGALGLVRLNTDFTLDTTFGMTSNSVNDLAIQPDGKIVAVGSFSQTATIGNGVMRFNADGTPDTVFKTNIGISTQGSGANAVTLQSDGKILIGNSIFWNGSGLNRLVRLNEDGTRDTTFNIGTGFNSTVTSIAVQTDGKILVGGTFTTYQGVGYVRIIRLNTDGSIDNTFNIGTGLNGIVRKIVIQSTTNKILIGGDFTIYNGVNVPRLIRLNDDGTRDTTFNGSAFSNGVRSIKEHTDGNLFIGWDGSPRLNKTDLNGNLDSGFNSNINPGVGGSAAVPGIAISDTGVLVVVGSQAIFKNNFYTGITTINMDGTTNSAITPRLGINAAATDIAFQQDGKAILVGGFSNWDNATTSQNRIARLNTDGTRDTTFNIGTGFNNGTALVAIRTDGKIIVHGQATSYNGVTTNQTTLLNSNGTRDTSFAAPIFVGQDIAVQSDNKIIIGGTTSYTIGGVVYNRLIRLNANGSVDTTFNMGTGLNAFVQQVTVMPDGKIMLSGAFATYNGATANRIMRLNADGTIDTTFNAPVMSSSVFAFAVQSDGKIVIGGAFNTVGGQARSRIARLNADGTLDNTFNIGTGFNNLSPIRMGTFSDDKVIIATQSITATYNGQFFGGVNRLNADGTLDTTFSNNLLGGNVSVTVSNIRQQFDKKIVVVGSFAGFSQKPYYSWARFGGEDA